MGIGPIPWTAIQKFAEVEGMTRPEFEEFLLIIRQTDAAYIEAVNDGDN